VSNHAPSSTIKVDRKGKHPWSQPFLNRRISMLLVLKLKNVMLGKYFPINTMAALQKTKGLA
jgi:hypothetical protein